LEKAGWVAEGKITEEVVASLFTGALVTVFDPPRKYDGECGFGLHP
jgi:hypothetical protein